MSFSVRLSALPAEQAAGRVYRLPTSAEWEYACRAGSASVFPWGDEDEARIGEFAWCHDWYGPQATQTHPVGTKKPNAWGFCDMLGNVWEWTSDGAWVGPGYAGCYYNKPGGLTDPVFPVDPKAPQHSLVIRGGAWNSDFRSANCFMVVAQRPLGRANDTGFRVKCTLVLPGDAGTGG
jgi:formylglycine-generating enzyme required for sulfatase activity